MQSLSKRFQNNRDAEKISKSVSKSVVKKMISTASTLPESRLPYFSIIIPKVKELDRKVGSFPLRA